MPRWFDQAECKDLGEEGKRIFFPEIERGQTSPRVWDEARAYCGRCVVSEKCLEYQMEFETLTARRDGMFGGLTPKERDLLADKRMRTSKPRR